MDDIQYLTAPPQIADILDRTEKIGFSMASEPRIGSLLATLAASKPTGRLLELGTGTGLSTAWMLSGMAPDARLTTVDTDPVAQGVARDALGSDIRVDFILADGLTWLRSQPAQSYDLIFADAMPGKYEGLEDALRLVALGGLYIIDDLMPQPNWPEGHAEKVEPMLQAIAKHPDFRITRLAWSSGIGIATRIKAR